MTRRIGRQRDGRIARHLPAGVRRTRHRPGIAQPQQQRRHAGPLRRQRQPPARGQVEHARIAVQLQHHAAQSRAAERIHPGPQQRPRIRQDGEQQPRRIEPEIGKARPVQRGAALHRLLAQPQDRRGIAIGTADDQRQHGGKTERAGKIARFPRENLVQAAGGQSAPQRLIERRHAQ